MHPTTLVLGLIVTHLFAALVGAITLTRWWLWRTSQPEVAREMLKSLYRRAHPNWLQLVVNGEADPSTRVCPCCGWSERETLAPGVPRCRPAAGSRPNFEREVPTKP